ncbi:MAG TPA: ferredoxin family protein [Spirochaetia bacterium]|nr:ferredoxin family protein [Spirochaetia bacterium]
MITVNYAHVEPDLCKGCRLCVETCPRSCLEMGTEINKLGYQYARFVNSTCTACGMCFYACPEPGAITVYKDEPARREIAEGVSP